jgi:pSer/pThr/pTyr-binding forkhead associated (FHA) protein
VYLEDYSFNGTYVNSEKIGKGNKRILKNNDHISLASPHFKGTQLMTSMKTRNVLYRFEIYITQSVLCVLLVYFNGKELMGTNVIGISDRQKREQFHSLKVAQELCHCFSITCSVKQ